jgi:anion-transporting  ArsA/GET3 family ATPase
VTGKGGTGKTTVAAAIGLAAAQRGLRVVVVEVSARDDISRALSGSAADVFAERAVGDGLYHVSIDPDAAMQEYLIDQLPSRTLADVLVRSKVFTYLAAATPGMRELLTVGKVWELCQPERRTPGARPYDLVVLDAPATGHGLGLVAAPRTFAEAARVGPIARQGRTIDEMLSSPERTAVLAVATAEEMPVNEALSIRDALGPQLAGVVVNGLLPQRTTAAEEAALAASPSPSARLALSHARRARAQRGQLARLRRSVDVPVTTLPFVFCPELGGDELRTLAGRFAA